MKQQEGHPSQAQLKMAVNKGYDETSVPLQKPDMLNKMDLDGHFQKRGKRPTRGPALSKPSIKQSNEVPFSSGRSLLQKQATNYSDPRRSAFHNSRSGFEVSPEDLASSGDEAQQSFRRRKPVLVSSTHANQKSNLYTRARSSSRTRDRSCSRSRDRSSSRPRNRSSSRSRDRSSSRSRNNGRSKSRPRARSSSRDRPGGIRNITRSSSNRPSKVLPRRSKSDELSFMVASLFDESNKSLDISSTDLGDLTRLHRSRGRSKSPNSTRDLSHTDSQRRSRSSSRKELSHKDSQKRSQSSSKRDLLHTDSLKRSQSSSRRRSRSTQRSAKDSATSSSGSVKSNSCGRGSPKADSESRARGRSRSFRGPRSKNASVSPTKRTKNTDKTETLVLKNMNVETDSDESCFRVVASASSCAMKGGSNHSLDSFTKPYIKPLSTKKGGEGYIKDANRCSRTKAALNQEQRKARKELLQRSFLQQESILPLKHKAKLTPKRCTSGKLMLRVPPQRTKSLDADQIIRPVLDVEFGDGANNTNLLEAWNAQTNDTTDKLSKLDKETRIVL